MNPTLREALDEGLATLTRVVATPVEPFDYGADVSCASDLAETMEDISEPRQILGEAIARRLDCPRGTNPDDADYGIDLRDMLHRGVTDSEMRTRTTAIEGELRKDDRILSSKVTLTPTATGDRIAILIVVVPRDPATGGPFTLTLALTDAGVLLEEMSR